MAIPSSINTGNQNAIYSVTNYIANTINSNSVFGTNVVCTQYYQTELFPAITFVEYSLPSKGDTAFGGYLGTTPGSTNAVFGHIEQTMLEINCMQLTTPTGRNAQEFVRRMAEWVKYVFKYAGRVEGTNLVLPGINLIDYYHSNAVTGSVVWHPFEDPNAWNQTPIQPDLKMPNLYRIRIYAKLNWFYYTQFS